MNAFEKLGIYGKGVADVAKARADAKRAAEHARKNFSKDKPYNCTLQPMPAPAVPAAGAAPPKT